MVEPEAGALGAVPRILADPRVQVPPRIGVAQSSQLPQQPGAGEGCPRFVEMMTAGIEVADDEAWHVAGSSCRGQQGLENMLAGGAVGAVAGDVGGDEHEIVSSTGLRPRTAIELEFGEPEVAGGSRARTEHLGALCLPEPEGQSRGDEEGVGRGWVRRAPAQPMRCGRSGCVLVFPAAVGERGGNLPPGGSPELAEDDDVGPMIDEGKDDPRHVARAATMSQIPGED
jgi:hypothetical protein